MALPVVLAPLIALLIRSIQIMMAAKAALWVVKILGVLGVLGLAFATNEYFMEPLLDHAQTAWNALPADAVVWAKALGLTEVASIMVTAYTLLAGKKVFMTAVAGP